MANIKELIKKKKERIIRWIKNPYNLIFLGIVILAIIIRLYYFFIVNNQPVWWDESEYLNMAKSWAFNLEYQFDPVRPIFFSLIMALFFKIANIEFLPRIFMLILSVVSVAGVYYLGKELYNKRVGILSGLFASIFNLNLFFTYRLQVDIPSLAFFIFSGILFYKYFKTDLKKLLYWAFFLAAIGTLFKLTTILILFVILIYLLITEKLNFIKKKEMWVGAIIFLSTLVPYFIWGYIKFNGFVITQASARNAPTGFFAGIGVLKNYINLFPTYFSWPFLISFILGLILMYKLILGFDILIKKGDRRLKRDLFLILMFLVPLILVSFSVNHNENRYILNAFPAIFIISSNFIIRGYYLIKKKNNFLAAITLILLIGFIISSQFQTADSLIRGSQNSYLEIKQAGEWLKENTEISDIIVTQSLHQIKYYSERETISFKTKEIFESTLTSNENIKYYLISAIQKSPDWTYTYPQEKNLTVVKAYFADISNEQPILIIYKFN